MSGQYDSNAFTTKDNEESDVALITSPQIEINSNWNRHALNFAVGATGAANKEYSENDYLDAFAEASGRLDVRRDDILTGTLRFDRSHEDRDDADNENGDDTGDTSDDNRGNLVRYYSGLVDGQYRHNFARFFTVLGAGIKRLEYENIGDRQYDRRNRTEYGGRARLGYQLSPRIGPFVQGNVSYRDYDDDQIIDGELADRSSTGYRASVGTTVDITSILFGEMSFGYEARDYEADQLNDSSGFGANGALTWNVTPLTTVILDASSGVRRDHRDVRGRHRGGEPAESGRARGDSTSCCAMCCSMPTRATPATTSRARRAPTIPTTSAPASPISQSQSVRRTPPTASPHAIRTTPTRSSIATSSWSASPRGCDPSGPGYARARRSLAAHR